MYIAMSVGLHVLLQAVNKVELFMVHSIFRCSNGITDIIYIRTLSMSETSEKLKIL